MTENFVVMLKDKRRWKVIRLECDDESLTPGEMYAAARIYGEYMTYKAARDSMKNSRLYHKNVDGKIYKERGK